MPTRNTGVLCEIIQALGDSLTIPADALERLEDHFKDSLLIVAGSTQMVTRYAEYLRLAINRNLPQLVERSIGLLMQKWRDQDKRINAYKAAEIADAQAHDLLIRACDVGVCGNRLIPSALHEWREPRHEAAHNGAFN